MSQSYWRSGNKSKAVFELYIRNLPLNRGYIVVSGIKQALQNVLGLQFDRTDIDELSKLHKFDLGFLEYLSSIEFTGTVRGMQDGDIVFADEPILQIEAPIIQGQLLETMLINLINYYSNVATKCSRVKYAGGDKEIIDFGARRAHGRDAANALAYAGYLTGFQGTATVEAGVNYSIPLFGTMAHSYIMSFENELDAFRCYADEFPDSCTLLVDTYDTISGVENAIVVAKELRSRGDNLKAIRLDSGDYLSLSLESRDMLDAAGFKNVLIVASGGLDEFRISELESKNAPIDIYGVGTRIAVIEDTPWLDSVYKMSAIDSRPVKKTSEGKGSYPHKKNVFRKYSSEGQFIEDLIVADTTPAPIPESHGLLTTFIENGKTLQNHPDLKASRNHFLDQFSKLDSPYKSILGPPNYPVSIDLL